MEIVERIAVTSVALMAFDWVLQFQVQLFLGLGSDSGAPRPYKVGPASKLISMAVFLVCFNVALSTYKGHIDFWVILSAALFLSYCGFAIYYAVSMTRYRGPFEGS
jgi:hypothetical protein